MTQHQWQAWMTKPVPVEAVQSKGDTIEGIKEFAADGIVGPQTWHVLVVPKSE